MVTYNPAQDPVRKTGAKEIQKQETTLIDKNSNCNLLLAVALGVPCLRI